MARRCESGAPWMGIAAICAVLASASASAETDPARFGVCPGLVQTVETPKVGDDLVESEIFVQLNEKGREELLEFTTSNLGKTTEIVFDGVILMRVKSVVPIRSGKLLTPRWQSAQAAARVAALLTASDPSVPCGPIS